VFLNSEPHIIYQDINELDHVRK